MSESRATASPAAGHPTDRTLRSDPWSRATRGSGAMEERPSGRDETTSRPLASPANEAAPPSAPIQWPAATIRISASRTAIRER